MEEEAEDIESLNPPKKTEEPWCSTCRSYTDYRRKWDAFPRANLDGGIYAENIESPHCIDCEQQMHYLSHCRRIAAFFTLLGMLIGGTGVICSLIIFPLSLGSLISAVLFCMLSIGISRIPRTSIKCLANWKVWKKEQGIKELTDMGLKH